MHVLNPSPAMFSRIHSNLIHSRPLPNSLEMDRQFPPEIIQLIVEASLDPYDLFNLDWTELESRYKILKKYSLLNWTWQGASAPSLHKLVVIETKEQVASFLDQLDAKGGIIGGIRDLRISLDGADRSDMARILRSARGALNVLLSSGVASVDDLAHLQQLRRLELFEFEVVGSPASSSLSLPSLCRLDLYGSSTSSSAAHFLTPSFLPQLCQLELYDLSGSVDPLIPQIEAISFGPSNNRPLSGAKSLRLLQFPKLNDDRLAVLSEFPSLPPFISINYVPERWRDVPAQKTIDALQQLLETTKKGLRVILLRDNGEDDAVDGLIQQLEGRAIRVVREKEGLNFNRAIRAMERVLAEEKRSEEKKQREK